LPTLGDGKPLIAQSVGFTAQLLRRKDLEGQGERHWSFVATLHAWLH
jgi:hypothetical protein